MPKFRILAEGDSWFDYPRSFEPFGKDMNIIDHLDDDDRFKITNISSNGDEAIDMLSGDSKFKLLKRISQKKYHILLFSGGGNDIVGKFDFPFFIKPFSNVSEEDDSYKELIHLDRFHRRIQQIKHAYMDMIELSTEEDDNIKIVTHTYDVAVPSKKGAAIWKIFKTKSWMYPYFKDKNYPIDNSMIPSKIVEYMLSKFRTELVSLSDQYRNLFVVDTHGTLTENDWLNEMHPSAEGFEKITGKIISQGIEVALNL